MRIRKEVAKDNILAKITSYDIFKKYVSGFDKVGVSFCSELRVDKNPTCKIIKLDAGLFYKDYAKPGVMDCFEYIKQKYTVNFQEALEMINLDFNLDLIPRKRLIYTPTESQTYDIDENQFTKAPTEIRVVVKDWDELDKRYWHDRYSLSTSDLNFYKVFPLKAFWINTTFIACSDPCYGYYFGVAEDGRQIWKIYRPYGGDFKWLSNCSSDIYQGYDQLPWVGEKLIITKSCKDVIVLNKIGYPAIAPQSEAAVIEYDFFKNLNNKFSDIRILYDNDAAGIEGAERLSKELNIPHFFLPQGTKDASDYVEKYSLEELSNYIETCWKNIG